MRCGCSNPGILGCTCTLVDSACIDVTGAGSSASKYSLAPIISATANNLLTCGVDGLLGSVSDLTISRRVSAASFAGVLTANETPVVFTTNKWASSTPLLWSAVTNPSRLTVPTGGAGKYLFIGSFQVGGSGSFLARASLRQNGANYRQARGVPLITNFSQNLLIATVVDMADGDYMELMAFQSSGSTQTLSGPFFAGCLLDKG